MDQTAKEKILIEGEEVFPFVKKLDQEERNRFIENSRTRNCKKGAMVHEGETDCTGVVGILQGRVKTFMLSSKGKEVALFRLLPKDACILS